MNGFGTERHRPLPVGFLAAGWADGNRGENRIVQLLRSAGIKPAYSEAEPALDCYQQYPVGPYALDSPGRSSRSRSNRMVSFIGSPARLCVIASGMRGSAITAGWYFRVDTDTKKHSAVQLQRVLTVVRALARS